MRTFTGRLLALLVVFTVTASFVTAQDKKKPEEKPTTRAGSSQKTYIERRDAYLKSAFLTKATWFTDMEKAKAEAAKSKKPILAYLTRSYSASNGCKNVEEKFLSDAGFGKIAANFVLYCHVTSKVLMDANQDWAKKIGENEVPRFVILDETGHVIGRIDDRPSAEEFQKELDRAKKFQGMIAKAKEGSRSAFIDVVEENIRLRNYTVEEAKAEIKKVAEHVKKDQLDKFERLLEGLAAARIIADIEEKEDRPNAVKEIEALRKAKKLPSTPSGRDAYVFLIGWYEDQKDSKTLVEMEKELKAMAATEKSWVNIVERCELAQKRIKEAK